ncbi:Ger(x)C family spore germination protein [Bacillus dakarensis]|uniref:Ger(x)C family spore germination protein n=1 Tax=Robertmurraya dakarensis TaxID=1926278 RepID=UPI0009824A6B|nr:Ger(x)C family spore germination protein [Bacillus dakarensis]
MNRSKPKLKQIFLVILLVPLLTGCWDSREIESRATVLAIGIDKADPDEEEKEDEISHRKGKIDIPAESLIKLTVQIAIPGRIPLGPQIGGGDRSPVLVVRAVGHTLEDALLNIQQEVASEVFLGHLRLIVLNEEVARDGVDRFTDYLRRNPEIRRTAALVVSKERAAKYMEIKPELERVPSLYLAEMVDSLIELGKFPETFIGMFWSILSSKGQDGYLPYFNIKGKSNIQINGLAYFKGDKMVGKTDPLQIGGFMAGIGAEEGGYGIFVKPPELEQEVLVRAVERKTRVKASLKNGKPHIYLKIRYESEIEEIDSRMPTHIDEDDTKALENEFSKMVKEGLEVLIAKTQEAKSDIFGFGEHFRGKFPDFWSKNVNTKENWQDHYANLTYDIEVITSIRRTGMKAR